MSTSALAYVHIMLLHHIDHRSLRDAHTCNLLRDKISKNAITSTHQQHTRPTDVAPLINLAGQT
uniref:Uncharacterized protein n=1 Tax=uncultured haloarchaeon TaxID=160804 RepID=A0A0K1YBD6_9EURY|nr:hypothetical protein [uncultured haloarchaeon]